MEVIVLRRLTSQAVQAWSMKDGWYEVTIPYSEFSNAGNIANHTGYLVGAGGNNGGTPFQFFFTDTAAVTIQSDTGTDTGTDTVTWIRVLL